MHLKKLIPALLGVAAIIAVVLALLPKHTQPDEDGPPAAVVGVVQILSESPWRDKVYASLSDAASMHNMQLITLETDRTQESQIQAIRTLITYQVDAIVFSPVVMSGWDNVLSETHSAGIPVILFERRIKTNLDGMIAATICTDYEAQGKAAAQFIKQAFPRHPGAVQIMEVTGTVGSSSSTERSRGIRTEFNKSPKYDLFYSLSCDLMYSKAKETFEIYLRYTDIPDVLISYNDAMTFGAIASMEKLGVQPGKDILIISFDAQQQAMDYLSEGKINCEIETSPYIGEAVINTISTLLNGPPSTLPIEVVTPFDVFTAEDIASPLPPRGY